MFKLTEDLPKRLDEDHRKAQPRGRPDRRSVLHRILVRDLMHSGDPVVTVLKEFIELVEKLGPKVAIPFLDEQVKQIDQEELIRDVRRSEFEKALLDFRRTGDHFVARKARKLAQSLGEPVPEEVTQFFDRVEQLMDELEEAPPALSEALATELLKAQGCAAEKGGKIQPHQKMRLIDRDRTLGKLVQRERFAPMIEGKSKRPLSSENAAYEVHLWLRKQYGLDVSESKLKSAHTFYLKDLWHMNYLKYLRHTSYLENLRRRRAAPRD